MLPKRFKILIQLDELGFAIGSPIGGAEEHEHQALCSAEGLQSLRRAVLIAELKGRQALANLDAGVQRCGRWPLCGKSRREQKEGKLHRVSMPEESGPIPRRVDSIAIVRQNEGMRWSDDGNSDDIEDQRAVSAGGGGGGGFGGMRLGIGGFLVLGVLSVVFRTDLISPFLGGGSAPVASREPVSKQELAKEEPMVKFVSFVFNDTQRTWTKLLPAEGVQYRRAKLVLFRDVVRSACGTAEAASGPFYCPGDEKAYIDLSFYEELRSRFKAGGDFAQAYVLAHEVGHHVQNVIGVEAKVRAAQQRNPRSAKALSVRVELQADCFAGVWGHSTAERGILQEGDVEEGLNAAAAIGDDRIQRMAGRTVSPESFTHGSSAQRMEWFKRGFDTGKISACDTFAQ